MKTLIVIVVAFVFLAGVGVTVNSRVQQLSKYPTGESLVMSDFNNAVLVGALELSGLEFLSYGETASNGLSVSQNYDMQYGHTPMQDVLTVQYQ